MTTYFEQVADSIMETPAYKKNATRVGSVTMINTNALRDALAAAAKMGAEAVTGLMPEHDVDMQWVCGVCREPIVAKDIDENHTIWVHAEEKEHG